MQLVSVREEFIQYTPLPSPAEFPEMVQLIKVAEEFPMHCTPPPPMPNVASFPEIIQLVIVGDESLQKIPPPPLP